MNFLVIVVDEMQAKALSCSGNVDVKTPNIDRLAKRGVNFKNAYCSNPVCMPSRATMMTGLTPRQNGCVTNGSKLPENIPTIGQMLQNHKYKTASFGKLHLQPFFTIEPHDSFESNNLWNKGEITKLPNNYYGFNDTYFVGGHVSSCFGEYKNWLEKYYPEYADKYLRTSAYNVENEITDCYKLDIPPEIHYNNVITDECIKYIDGLHEDDDFFIFCSYPDPHFPFSACKPYSEMYDKACLTLPENWNDTKDPIKTLVERRSAYTHYGNFSESGLREALAQTYGMITHIDDNIGRLMNSINKNGFDKNTTIVFMADHGDYLGDSHLVGKDIWPYDSVYKVPYIWAVPYGHNCQCDTPVSLLDFVPTVLGLANVDEKQMDIRGIRYADYVGLPGRDLSQFIKNGEFLKEIPILIEYDEDWHEGPIYRIRTIVYDGFKLTIFSMDDGLLFDLKNDPNERENLFNSADYVDKKLLLLELLIKELERTDRLADNPRICGA